MVATMVLVGNIIHCFTQGRVVVRGRNVVGL